ncbi:hypothetical protein PSP6_660002 [Paraburkholderia tropica]|nr:hypothetical protein PSP6_660002 [Paraburkholderia tropica]
MCRLLPQLASEGPQARRGRYIESGSGAGGADRNLYCMKEQHVQGGPRRSWPRGGCCRRLP